MVTHVFIKGKVQGVGFRQYIKYKANKLKIKGWVKNLPDGRVEAVFIGNDKEVKKMIGVSKNGPFLAEVENIEVDWNHELLADIIDFQIVKE